MPSSSTAAIAFENGEADTRLQKMIDWTKRMILLWDDLTEFFYDYNPEYKKVGARDKNMIDLGMWDDPDSYDASYNRCNEWGEARWATPGVVIDGELVTTKLQQINLGLEEFVEHSYYENWNQNGDVRYKTDPSGAPLSPNHPWNKETMPKPSKESWKNRYAWSTAPRWDRQVVEAGAYARIWTTAAAGLVPKNDFLESTGHSFDGAMEHADWIRSQIERPGTRIPDTWRAIIIWSVTFFWRSGITKAPSNT